MLNSDNFIKDKNKSFKDKPCYKPYTYNDYKILQKSYPSLTTSIRNNVGNNEWFRKHEKLNYIKNYSDQIYSKNSNLPKINFYLEKLNYHKQKRLNKINSIRNKCYQYCNMLNNRNKYNYILD